ncbi:MAG: hypothetical protein V1800_04880, partial [Candidatus Latescibacterota bacterium]
NRWGAELGLRRLGHAEELRALNRTGRVFGQREGQTVHWEEQVESRLELADLGPWKNGAAKGTVRLSMKNTGRVPSSGTVKLMVSPAEVIEESLPHDIRYDLEPGQSVAREIPVRSLISGLAIKADSEEPALTGSILQWRPEAWAMTRLPSLAATDEIPSALSAENWQNIHWYKTQTAAVRIAAAGDAFALHAKVNEPQGLLGCSKFEMFVLAMGATDVSQLAFLPVESTAIGKEKVRLYVNEKDTQIELFPCEINMIHEGYEVKALIPRALFGISRDARECNLEFMATTGAADFGWHANCLFGSARRRSFMKVMIDE